MDAPAVTSQTIALRPRLSLLRIIEMNVGFFGLQMGFGLQQANMGPIYGYLGADPKQIPWLFLAGPMTGLIVQPIIGALSDRTATRIGRRTPYFLIGAVISSLSLLAMPHSSALWMAAALLWTLDAGNNVTMEPYRAYVADRMYPDQRPVGFLTQSAFTGLAQTLAYLSPSLLAFFIDKNILDPNGVPAIVRIAFTVGAVVSAAAILYSILRVPEGPVAAETPVGKKGLGGLRALGEIWRAILEMPPTMRALIPPMFCQWYAMFTYWQFIAFALARSLYGVTDARTPEFREAALIVGQIGAVYNCVAFLAALALIPIVKRLGARPVHAVCLTASGLALLALPTIGDRSLLILPMIGVGLGWAGMMGNTYVMLADAIPPERNGVYMGIFNMFIVVPMLIETVTMPRLYAHVLGGDARNVIAFCGALMLLGAITTLLSAKARPAKAA